MLIAAFALLVSAVLLGSVLAILHLRRAAAARPAWAFGVLHGLVAIAGLVCLLAALGGPPRGLDTGTSSFGVISAGLIASAALLGGGIFWMRLRKRRLMGVLIGTHATLAVFGFVVLAAYIFVR